MRGMVLGLALLFPVGVVDAHGGRTNACGCHYNRKTGECHCHNNQRCGGCECQPKSCPKAEGKGKKKGRRR